jgi:hypothetical protein
VTQFAARAATAASSGVDCAAICQPCSMQLHSQYCEQDANVVASKMLMFCSEHPPGPLSTPVICPASRLVTARCPNSKHTLGSCGSCQLVVQGRLFQL